MQEVIFKEEKLFLGEKDHNTLPDAVLTQQKKTEGKLLFYEYTPPLLMDKVISKKEKIPEKTTLTQGNIETEKHKQPFLSIGSEDRCKIDG